MANRPPLADPRDGEVMPGNEPLPASQGSRAMAIGSADMGFLMTAKRIEVARKDPGKMRQALSVLCAQNGDHYVYSWKVKGRRNNRETTIEGLTVKGAMDLARTYGNCFAGLIGVDDMGTHWLFKAAFCDLETGFNVRRDFMQRKGQQTGMADSERQSDIVFQIGQSKAIRNVIVQANPSDCNFMLDESKKRLVEWVNGNLEKCNTFIDGTAEEYGIPIANIEAVIGRARPKWTVREIARVLQELRGVQDGLTRAEEVYPSESDAAKVAAAKAEKREDEGKKAAPKQKDPPASPSAAKTASAETADEPLPEPLPEPLAYREDPRLFVKVPSIESFGTRTQNALKKAKKAQVGHLVTMTEADLTSLGAFGQKSLSEVKAYMAEAGLSLGSKLMEGAPPASKEPAGEPEPETGGDDAPDDGFGDPDASQGQEEGPEEAETPEEPEETAAPDDSGPSEFDFA